MSQHEAHQSPQSPAQYDVAIVGYGPVGQTLSILLGELGYRVIVIERWPSLYPLPRAVFHDHEIRRIFRHMGLEDELQRISQPSSCYQWFNADWKPLVEIDWSAESVSGGPYGYLFNQPGLEDILDRRAKSIDSVDVVQGWEVVEIRQDDHGCRLRARTTPSEEGKALDDADEMHDIHARFVVGTDGANSFVRRSLGIGWLDLGFQEDWLVVDIQPHPGVTLDVPDIGQWCNPARPTTMVPGGPGYRRWEFMRLPHESMEDLSSPEKVWELLSPWLTSDDAHLVRHAVYHFRSLIADDWRQGRVMIAGDAAHVMPPFMGQGMCSGIRDAWNLSWRLDLILRGTCEAQLLDGYTKERKPQIQSVIEASIAMGRIVCVSDLEAAAERDRAYLSGEATPPPPFPGISDGLIEFSGDGAPKGHAGRLGVHGEVEVDGRLRRYDDCLDRGFHLIVGGNLDPHADLDLEYRNLLEVLDIHVVRIDDGSYGWRDVTGKYQAFLIDSGNDYMLVRPDFYLYADGLGVEALQRTLDCLAQGLRVRQFA